jgi:hypothetical protein
MLVIITLVLLTIALVAASGDSFETRFGDNGSGRGIDFN